MGRRFQQRRSSQAASSAPVGAVSAPTSSAPTAAPGPSVQYGRELTGPQLYPRALGGRSFSQAVPQILSNLPVRNALDVNAVSLRELTGDAARAELGGKQLFGPQDRPQVDRSGRPLQVDKTQEFDKVVTFNVPAGSRQVGFESFRFGYENGGPFTGKMNYSFDHGPVIRSRTAHLYEVHVERKGNVDQYTIAMSKDFIGGLKVTVDGKSTVILSHQEQKSAPPPKANPPEEPASPSDRVPESRPSSSPSQRTPPQMVGGLRADISPPPSSPGPSPAQVSRSNVPEKPPTPQIGTAPSPRRSAAGEMSATVAAAHVGPIESASPEPALKHEPELSPNVGAERQTAASPPAVSPAAVTPPPTFPTPQTFVPPTLAARANGADGDSPSGTSAPSRTARKFSSPPPSAAPATAESPPAPSTPAVPPPELGPERSVLVRRSGEPEASPLPETPELHASPTSPPDIAAEGNPLRFEVVPDAPKVTPSKPKRESSSAAAIAGTTATSPPAPAATQNRPPEIGPSLAETPRSTAGVTPAAQFPVSFDLSSSMQMRPISGPLPKRKAGEISPVSVDRASTPRLSRTESSPPTITPARIDTSKLPARRYIPGEFELSVSPKQEPVFDRAKEQRRAMVGHFAMQYDRKELDVPYDRIEDLPEPDRKAFEDFQRTVYSHAYKTPEQAMYRLYEIRPKDEYSYDRKSQLEETDRELSAALEGTRPKDQYDLSPPELGTYSRADRIDQALPKFRSWLEARPELGAADVRDVERLAERMRGVGQYLDAGQQYVRKLLSEETGAAVAKQPYRHESGFHIQVVDTKNALNELFSAGANPLSFEKGLAGLERLSDFRVWEFSDADVSELKKLLTKAEAECGKAEYRSSFLPKHPPLSRILAPMGNVQQGRAKSAVKKARDVVSDIEAGRALLPYVDRTDEAVASFLGTGVLYSRLAPPRPGEMQDSRKAFRDMVTSIEAEAKLLDGANGNYARVRLGFLKNLSADLHAAVSRERIDFLDEDKPESERLASLGKLTVPPLSQASSGLSGARTFFLALTEEVSGVTRSIPSFVEAAFRR